ncbi:MAG: site-2 protease family protein [Caldilineaceae bacterium]
MIIYLVSTNILLVIFNLLPAFPMDGGRVLQALLAMAMPVRHLRIAVYVGRIMALIFAVVGIAGGGIFPAAHRLFVYVGGSAELENVTNRSVLRNIDVGRACTRSKDDALHQRPAEPGRHAADDVAPVGLRRPRSEQPVCRGDHPCKAHRDGARPKARHACSMP